MRVRAERKANQALRGSRLSARPAVARARRIVIKLGTRVLVDDHGRLAEARLTTLVATVAALRRSGREVMLVSSGAIGVGRALLGLPSPPRQAGLRQACAATGQMRLSELYRRCFAGLDLLCGQVLVNQGDFGDRCRTLRLREALVALSRRRVVPVVNENDAVAVETLPSTRATPRAVFADNDRLAALVAGVVDADLLVLLTDVDGLYDRDPRLDPEARVLTRIEHVDQWPVLDERPGSEIGRGGMASKVRAAWIARSGGCQAVIANGRVGGTLSHVVAGEAFGTWFPTETFLPARHRWIAFAATSRGALHLDAGAVAALRSGGASLLPAGIVRVAGRFAAGDVVELVDPTGQCIGRAHTHLGDKTIRRRCACRRGRNPALIRRHHIVLDPQDQLRQGNQP